VRATRVAAGSDRAETSGVLAPRHARRL